MSFNMRDLLVIGVLIAFSFIFSTIKITGNLTLELVPIFLALFVFKDFKAAIIGFISHLLIATMSGFETYTLIGHIIMASSIALMLVLASLLIKKFNNITAFGFIFMFNVLVVPLSVYLVIPFSLDQYSSIFNNLALSTLFNLVIALFITRPIKNALRIPQ